MVAVVGPVYRNHKGEVTSTYRERLIPKSQTQGKAWEDLTALGVELASNVAPFQPKVGRKSNAEKENEALKKQLAELQEQLAAKQKGNTDGDQK